MASPNSDAVRIARLSAFFNNVLHGQRKLSSAREGKLFIDGICVQSDVATCAHKLISSKFGLSALKQSVMFDTSIVFLNDHALRLLRHLQLPFLKAVGSGSILAQLLLSMVEPPFFWDALRNSYTGGILNADASRAFAWLLSELVSLPGKASQPYLLVANKSDILDSILKSPDGETRILGQKIRHALPSDISKLHSGDADSEPGGRHDNDHADYRAISIMPTSDELLSKDLPFFRNIDYIYQLENASSRSAIHLDNQFRLLREDMLGEIRDEMKTLTGKTSRRHKGIVLDGLSLAGVEMGTEQKRRPWSVVMSCKNQLPGLDRIKQADKREKYLKDNRHILKHGNMACLLIEGEPAAFPTIHRNEEDLSKIPATIALQFADDRTLPYALSKMKTASDVKLAQLDTATFAFEPFLRRLQEMKDLPLSDCLLHWEAHKDTLDIGEPSFRPAAIVKGLEMLSGKDLKDLLRLKQSVILDETQMASLCRSLLQRVSLIQGPPGTGKSFIGALVAKVLHDFTPQKILVVCFTNHALDQFLEDMMDSGIPCFDMIRLGGKSTARTKPLMLRDQTGAKLSPTQWAQINSLKLNLEDHETKLQDAFKRYRTANVSKPNLMQYLEFLSEDLPFFEAFEVPKDGTNDMTRIGKKGKAMGQFYLLDRWTSGASDAGSLQHLQPKGAAAVWKMSRESRASAVIQWREAILDELVDEIRHSGRRFNLDQSELDRIFGERDAGIIQSKRIIACTTNGAARYSSAIQSASPGVVLVEEAGEILEAHIITSLGAHTEQLIMIGDHKQLRPKCSYNLSVEQREGFDLNRSLFERLVLKGFPHVTLTQQHRMRPEISSLIRHLTYPDLADAASTLQRPDLLGFRDNVIFVDHRSQELELHALEKHDKASSKQNVFESQMILKCVRYLAQQGYDSGKIVVLTPYLGQLKLLRDQLSETNDPILNDLDKFALVSAGLLSDASSRMSKPQLKISTIDNYQGEESDIVLVSMTRSNKSHDIGFMAAPERLNVMLSRARNALIMIGNSETFMNARKGQELWRKFFAHLNENNHVYSGFPVRCERHPDRTALLSSTNDFELRCPDGGCIEQCGAILRCGLHKCPSSCHQVFDHSKTLCRAALSQTCPTGHKQSWQCHAGAPLVCIRCNNDRKRTEEKSRRDLQEKIKRDERSRDHLQRLAQLEQEIDRVNQQTKDVRLDREQQAILAQKQKDLAAAKTRAYEKHKNHQGVPPADTGDEGSDNKASLHEKPSKIAPRSPTTRSVQRSKLRAEIKTAIAHNKSSSKTEWQRQKDQENANNPAIDEIMEMIGLEDVKDQILKVKGRVEISTRQGTDLRKERLGLVLLGNPGTGKTTVARHYARVLTSLQVLSGDGFVETTGSRLAHGSVTEVKSHLKTLDDAEGGVYFIDEAYQLAEGHNSGGKTVLDYLLAEIENLTGKVVFVFAGYRKEMEKFFEHNPGFSSRIPYTFCFEDYTDAELLAMLQLKLNQHFENGIDIEGGFSGLYMRIAVGRLGRGRGKDGFGNARALENMFAQIRSRQSDRIVKQRIEGLSPDDFQICKEDLIGPVPSEAIRNSDAWIQLKQMTGLKSVKESVKTLIEGVKTNYDRELKEQKVIDVSLNRVFLGSPGTGKTSVAKLYGRILKDLGILSNGEVVVKNPADFIGSAIGESEKNTKAILATTIGKVLIIDEAYMLYSSSDSGKGGGADEYKKSVIDTIVAEVQSVPGDDRCVLLLGYEQEMQDMFQNVNPGLARRFQLSEAFKFEDFSDAELQEILLLKLKNQDLGASDRAVSTAIAVLSRLRNGLNFGNGGDVENLISKAKSRYQARQSALPPLQRSIDFVFEPQDFDADHDRASTAGANLEELFKGVVGCEDIIEKLKGFLAVAKGMRAQGLDPRDQIPMSFIFKGPPGTGKTTTARKFGQVYYDLGFLSKVEVVECSATDLIGQYIGHTGPKVIKQLERGLGKVLFVDEAYRLGEGTFAQEAVNELVDSITKPKFAGKLVIILAGYDKDMNQLLRCNEGLSSRFATEIVFPSLDTTHCLQLLEEKLKGKNISFPAMQIPDFYQKLLDLVGELSKLPGWGNARDVQTLASSMVREVYQTTTEKVHQLHLNADTALDCVRGMLSARKIRADVQPLPQPSALKQLQSLHDHQPAPRYNTRSSSARKALTELAHAVKAPDPPPAPKDAGEGRDAGVSDAVWQQLQADKSRTEEANRQAEQLLRQKEAEQKLAEEAARKAKEAAVALQAIKAKNKAQALELLRQREEARIREVEAKAEMERARQECERQRQAEIERKKKEAVAQAKLRNMGVCCMGYTWIKQHGGWSCRGGTHWVSDSQLWV